jgi:hypothetical protein
MQMQDPEMEPDEGNHSTDALQFYGAAGETYVHVSSDTTHASGVLCLCIIMMVMQVHSAGHRRDKLVLLDLRLEAIQLPDLLLAILAGTLELAQMLAQPLVGSLQADRQHDLHNQ